MTDKQRIKELEEKLAVFEKSPYKNGYLSSYTQISTWDKKMIESPISLEAVGEDDLKAFDKAIKYLERKKALFEDLDYFRSKMTAEEKKDVDKLETASHSVESFLLNGV